MQERDGYFPLVSIDESRRIHRGNSIDFKSMFEHIPEATTIDKESLALIQVGDLHSAIDHTITYTGSATLFRSLMQPPVSAELIWAKQNSVRELESNTGLKKAIIDYLHEFQIGEQALFKFLNDELDPREFSFYGELKDALKGGQNILKAAEAIPTPESPYTRYLVNSIERFENSNIYRLMRGPIYNTFRGLRSKEDVRLFTPRLKFRPSRLDEGTLAPILPFFIVVGGRAAGLIDPGLVQDNFAVLMCVSFSLTGIMLTPMLMLNKPQFDYSGVVRPLKQETVRDNLFVGAVDAVGMLDELNSFVEFRKAFLYSTTMPTVTNDERHHFAATSLRNPILGKESQNYVPNTVELDNDRITFITGPNSGGKTALCKSIVQNQLLAQIGSYVTASEAVVNVADRIAYQAPHFNALQDTEGRFGTELQRTKKIFFSVSPKSLVILDELAEGTTKEEKMVLSKTVLDGFNIIGNTTILVTHNHELVSEFKDKEVGQLLQVEFVEGKPTFRIIGGISTDSHAIQVAERVGFSQKEIDAYLIYKGYLK